MWKKPDREITGTVFDADTENPITGVAVKLWPDEKESISGSDGKSSFAIEPDDVRDRFRIELKKEG